MVLKVSFFPLRHFFESTVKTVTIWIAIFYSSWLFAILAALFLSSVSLDPSKIIQIGWFGARETFLLNNVENSCAA